MVLRKPYAFILKNFKKIHILMLALSIYIYFKDNQIAQFVNQFIATNTYNPMVESIRDYISIFPYFVLAVMIIISAILIYVLHYKKKPWKAYLIPFISSLFIFFVIMATARYFNHYGDESTLAAIRTISQLLQMCSLIQYAVFILLFIRITGLDLKKFDFAHDQEYLEIHEEDREEFEVNFELDKDRVVRFFKKKTRQMKYLYQEHPLIFNILFGIVIVGVLGYTYYYFGILNRTFKEGQSFNALSYKVTIEKSYFTDKDYGGNLIKEGKDYVAVIVRMKNNGRKRAITPDRFHLLNKNHMYSYTRLVDSSFKDLGATYPKRELANGEEVTFYLVYEVDQGLSSRQFVLYYQDIQEKDLRYRKVKLSPEDLHQIKTVTTKKVGEEMQISGIFVDKKHIQLTGTTLEDKAAYSVLSCTAQGCSVASKTITNDGGKIFALYFASLDFDATDFLTFSINYGHIKYKDSTGKNHIFKIKKTVDEDYLGQALYIKVPQDFESATSIQLIYTIRNKSYVFAIK